MSRSVHANRSWRAFEQRGFHDWTAIAAKRRVKSSALESRRKNRLDTLPSDRLPRVATTKLSGSYFFPASSADIEAVLRRLPPGSTQGLASVSLDAPESEGGEHVFPGVWVPSVRGTYCPDSNIARLFAYSREGDAPITPDQAQELRYIMLRTLVHEVAHHLDRISRVGRGRWRMDDRPKAEAFADKQAMQWCLEVVVPYLSETYGCPTDEAV